MAIPFTQYLLPDGRRAKQAFDAPPAVEALAKAFILSGGRYECEVLTSGQVSLTAVKTVNGEPQDVEIEICENGPAVPAAVESLVRRSVEHV